MRVVEPLDGRVAAERARRASAARSVTFLRLSYVKTVVPALVMGVLAIVLAHRLASTHPTMVRMAIVGIGWILGLGLKFVAAGGLIALIRDHRDAKGDHDLFLAANEARSERALMSSGVASRTRWSQRARRALGQGGPLVGEEVEIRSSEEIGRILDDSGRLDGLSFMSEMTKFCGQRARVFRCVDKVYDYGGQKTLRRLENVVLLTGLRCDGSAHGGCQAACYLLWKDAWLSPVTRTRPAGAGAARSGHPSPPAGAPRGDRYSCQFTDLVAASRSMARWDVRQDFRPLLAGNVTISAFCVAVLTRAFNAVQRARGGVGYPAMGHAAGSGAKPIVDHLSPGDAVRVRPSEDISATLDERGRDRGLWFDREMMKHCGRRYAVLGRVDRIIDDATGRMLRMKHPCIVLDGVDSSGEFLRLCAQHEYPFWREAWLSPEHADPGTPS